MTKKSFDLAIVYINELLTIKGASKHPKIGKAMKDLGVIKDGAIAIKNGKIVFVGETKDILPIIDEAKKVIIAKNRVVMPGFVDCHTHLLFGGSREQEFVEKIKGTPYLEILGKGNGILSTVKQTRKGLKHPAMLISKTLRRLRQMLGTGTTTAEVKSGYGLDMEAEMQMLKWIKRLDRMQSIDLVSCFLGAHAIPEEYKGRKKEYINLVLEMLLQMNSLSEFCDVFCEEQAFSAKEAEIILSKAKELGKKVKLHTNEFNDIQGIDVGIKLGAISMDHLDCVSDKDIKKIAESKIISVLLPGVAFHLMSNDYAPARKMIETGVPVAIASDFNPGSCPCFSMQTIIALACRMMKMTPEETINAATINAAHALGKAREIGSLEIGKKADIIILDIPNYRQLPYWFGDNLVDIVIKSGKIVVKR